MKSMELEQLTPRMDATTRVSMLSMQLLLALNAALMFAVLVSGWSMYQDVSTKMRMAEDLLSTPEQLAPYAEVVLREAATSFILGAVNGSIAQFVGDMLRAESYAAMAEQLNDFSSSVIAAFEGSDAACNDYVTCPYSPSGQYPFSIQCNTGKLVWCYYQNQQINCANQSCVAPYVYSVATFVNSVSSLVSRLNGPTQTANSDAALNSGLLNIEALIPWVQRQADSTDWFNAGVRCKSLTQKVLGVSWNGQYVDFDGQVHTFDVSSQVGEVVGYVNQVCNDLVKITSAKVAENNAKKSKK